MDSEILYELARVNVYGDLEKALAPLVRGSLSLLARDRAQIGGFHNDARFYLEAGMAARFVSVLRDFCEARRRGVGYEDARAGALAGYEELSGIQADPQSMVFLPGSFFNPLDGQSDAVKDDYYRFRFVDEFSTLLTTLSHYLIEVDNHFWAHRTVSRHIADRLEAFRDPQTASAGFGAAPPTAEEEYFNTVVKWLRARGVLADAKRQVGDRLHTAGIGPVFDQAVDGNPEAWNSLVHYSTHCEIMADHLSLRLCNGELPGLYAQAAVENAYMASSNDFDMTRAVKIEPHKALFSFLQDYIIAAQAELAQMDADGQSLGPDYERFSQSALQQLSLDLMTAFYERKPAVPAPQAQP
ncbi:MAG: hypothetical protein HYS17_11820 [Micavibrio aeruginosavorus]|uniref:Uncharacterized protein n=1 Tax=Micavibrio aeruginosavorus TaxID=349221 RepID=A0A7T5R243_9BACT|nr:MAG: hypothetical protein HYS17_11820 [Micavibrio aeruginosavorus]